VKLVGADGKVSGERRFIGLYTSTAYFGSYADIPIVRRNARTSQRAGFLPNGHLGKSLVTVLETYPRDELFRPTKTSSTTSRSASRLQETSAHAPVLCGATASTASCPVSRSCRAL
jgi:NAD-specific glutamate dehydrogenase